MLANRNERRSRTEDWSHLIAEVLDLHRANPEPMGARLLLVACSNRRVERSGEDGREVARSLRALDELRGGIPSEPPGGRLASTR